MTEEAEGRGPTLLYRLGGRKQLNGYLYVALLTWMVPRLGGTFTEYATALGAALLGTSAIVAWEDSKRRSP